MKKQQKLNAFTLAETLITLMVIGVIAVVTIPALKDHSDEVKYVTAIKKAYSSVSSATAAIEAKKSDAYFWNFMAPQTIDWYKETVNSIPNPDPSHTSWPIIDFNGTNDDTFTPSLWTADGMAWMFRDPGSGMKGSRGGWIVVDINGKAKPNIYGRDKFIFYIFSQKADWYNTGSGNVAKNIPGAGLYPDGYGYDRERMKNDSWRGCNRRGDEESLGNQAQAGAFCTAMIMLDGWKISDDYKW